MQFTKKPRNNTEEIPIGMSSPLQCYARRRSWSRYTHPCLRSGCSALTSPEAAENMWGAGFVVVYMECNTPISSSEMILHIGPLTACNTVAQGLIFKNCVFWHSEQKNIGN